MTISHHARYSLFNPLRNERILFLPALRPAHHFDSCPDSFPILRRMAPYRLTFLQPGIACMCASITLLAVARPQPVGHRHAASVLAGCAGPHARQPRDDARRIRILPALRHRLDACVELHPHPAIHLQVAIEGAAPACRRHRKRDGAGGTEPFPLAGGRAHNRAAAAQARQAAASREGHAQRGAGAAPVKLK